MIDLLSSLLGSLSGAMGLIIMVLQWVDAVGENENYDEDADKLEDKFEGVETNNESKYIKDKEMMTEKNNNNNKDTPPISAADYAKLSKLLNAGISLKQAEAIIRVIDIGVDPSIASPLPVSSVGDFAQSGSGAGGTDGSRKFSAATSGAHYYGGAENQVQSINVKPTTSGTSPVGA